MPKKTVKSVTTASKKASSASVKTSKQRSVGDKIVSFIKRPVGIVVLFVLLFSAVGGYAVLQSHAATSYLSQYGCFQRGRVWTGSTTGNPCANKCYPAKYWSYYDYETKQTVTYWGQGSGSLVYATPYNYCSGAVTKASVISYDSCWNNLSRAWVSGIGCARDWRRISPGIHSQQCRYTTYYYHPAPSGGYDYCSAHISDR